MNEQWPGLTFRGFDIADINTIDAERAAKIREIVESLNNKQPHVRIDSVSVEENSI